MVTVQLRQLRVPPGQRVLLDGLTWREFEAILAELGEHQGTRLAYSHGTLEIMTPLPEHEVSKELIGDAVKILLDELGLDCECFGSTTFKREDMSAGIEPDTCFYLQHHALMRGKQRLNLAVDPPPDLAIEVDVTSKTQLDAYESLGIAELWRYESNQLTINLLIDGRYVDSKQSLAFPDWPISAAIAQVVQRSKNEGRSPALRLFRQWVKEQIITMRDNA